MFTHEYLHVICFQLIVCNMPAINNLNFVFFLIMSLYLSLTPTQATLPYFVFFSSKKKGEVGEIVVSF